ncbi:aldo/keto reductase [Nonomuraea dietziae]|uniref:aldo/keto reductase n=1 Tax=Nonomuraea dietziae TaxID=65515 RepID=UPI003CD0C1AE
MEYVNLGRTGLKVSPLCLGTMNFGPQTTEEDSFAIMDRALELGINFFDTANVYGWKLGEGVTENIVGRWFAQGGGRRERTVIATKFHGKMGEWPNEGMQSALHIRRACDASLKRLQTDYIDIFQAHHIGRETPFEEFWEAMDILRQQGKIIYVGSSNYAGWHIAKAQESAARKGMLGLVSEQSHYNLLTRKVELEVLPACEDYGLGVIPWSPLAGGPARRRATQDRQGPLGLREHGQGARQAPREDRAVRGVLRRARRGPRARRPGLAADPPRRDRPDHRPAHARPARRHHAHAGDRARRQGPRQARRDLPRPQDRAGGLRLVIRGAHPQDGLDGRLVGREVLAALPADEPVSETAEDDARHAGPDPPCVLGGWPYDEQHDQGERPQGGAAEHCGPVVGLERLRIRTPWLLHVIQPSRRAVSRDMAANPSRSGREVFSQVATPATLRA